MTTYAKLKVSGVVFDAKGEANAVEGELYVDSVANQLSVKGAGSSTTPIGAAPSSDSQLRKLMQNLSGADIDAGDLVCKMADGSIAGASSDQAGKKSVIGTAAEPITDGAIGTVALFGPNMAGALAGLGFAPGDKIYMAETTGGYTANLGIFTGGNDRLVRVGLADCAAGAASATAVDLICILSEEVADII